MNDFIEKLSVVIPVYNSENYLSEAVESVRMQNWPGEVEVIIVDDGSVDGSLQKAREQGNIVITQQRNGAAKARNEGLLAATGTWLMLLDADDVLTEGALEKLHAPFAEQPSLMAVFARAKDFFSPELTEGQRSTMRSREESYGGVLPGCALLRREVFDIVGLFDETLKSGETIAWMMKLRDMKLAVTQISDVTLRRRLHLANTGRMNHRQEMKNYADILRRRMRRR